MIAYSHDIQFTPLSIDEKGMLEPFSKVVTVCRSVSDNKKKKLSHKIAFINNQGRDIALYSEGKFNALSKDQMWAFEVEGVLTFYWQQGSLKLEYVEHENFTDALLEYWVLHSVLPILFTVRETYDFLHAGAVEVEGKPILFIAESFGGKSTMTDYFMKRGHTMVSDDSVGTYEKKDVFYAVPSHPHHRPYRKMEDLGFFVENAAKEPKPIHGIYKLEKNDAKANVEIVQLQGIERFKVLYHSSLINLSFQKEKRFVFLSRLAKVVPVYRVTVPWDLERLPEVYDMIVKHSNR